MFCPSAVVWGTVAQWVGALATFSAVVVALFGERIRATLFRPRLELSLLSTEGERTTAQFNVPIYDGIPYPEFEAAQRAHFGVACRFFHIRVQNVVRWPAAKDVRLFLTRIDDLDQEGSRTRTWQVDLPMSAKNEDLFPARKIVGPPLDFEVISVDCEGWMHLHTLFNNFQTPQHLRAPVRRRLFFEARCDEQVSRPIGLEVQWDGKWFEDWNELKQHLLVKQVETPNGAQAEPK
jgi:hypothetical protein